MSKVWGGGIGGCWGGDVDVDDDVVVVVVGAVGGGGTEARAEGGVAVARANIFCVGLSLFWSRGKEERRKDEKDNIVIEGIEYFECLLHSDR